MPSSTSPARHSSKSGAARETQALETCLRVRAVVLTAIFALIFSLLGWRLVKLHLYADPRLVDVSRESNLYRVELPAMRGAILDRQGEILAIDRRAYTVVADRNLLRDPNLAMRALAAELGKSPRDIPKHFNTEEMKEASVRRTVQQVAPQLGMEPEALLERIGPGSKGEVVLVKDLDDEAARRLEEFLSRESIAGIIVRESYKRSYPYPDRAVHVVGFVNSKGEGVEGVEKTMDELLKAQPGYQWIERDALGNETRSMRMESHPAVAGHSIRLTLDIGVQNILEEELSKTGSDENEVYAPALNADGLCVILMEPATNAIIALANRPQHDLETRHPLTPNFAVSETYEPGSTFKICSFTGVLDQGLVGLATPLYLHGGRYVKGEISIRDDHPLENATVLTAFAYSSNIASYKLAAQLGGARYYDYVTRLGFGARTGVALTNEAAGTVNSPANWGTLSLRSMSFGYEVNVTPLQLLNAYVALLNGGQLRRPFLVEAVLNDENEVVKEFAPEVIRQACSARAARQLKDAMVEVVKKGTARKAAMPGFIVGGKTGTSQRYNPQRKRYVDGEYVVSFVGFVESSRGPELAGVVVIDNPKVERHLRYGGHLAAPLFRRVAQRVLAHRNIAPDSEAVSVMIR